MTSVTRPPADDDALDRALRAGLADFELTDEDRALVDDLAPDESGAAGTGPVPVVAIVGRPNVGKSTLVNRILRRREAVVEDVPASPVTACRMTRNGPAAAYRRRHRRLVDRRHRHPPAGRRTG